MYFQAVAVLCISLFRGSSGKLEGEVQRVWGERLKRQRCYAKKKQYSDDCPGYPVFGCRSIGVFTLDGCKAECNADAIDKRGRPCIGIQWKDGTKIWSASTKKTCSLLWACDKIGGHPGGSTWLVSNEPVPAPKTSAPVPAPKTSAPVPAPKTLSPVPAPKTLSPVPAPKPVCNRKHSTNISKGKWAGQSCNHGSLGHAGLAIDGNTDGDWYHKSVTHTCVKAHTKAWWSVFLGYGPWTITKIVVWNRTDQAQDRIKDGKIEIFNTPPGQVMEFHAKLMASRVFGATQNKYTFELDCVPGNEVTISVPDGIINLAEVEVFGYATP